MAETPSQPGTNSTFSSNYKRGRTLEEGQAMITRCLKSPMVKFLRENLEKAGCHIGDDFFQPSICEGNVSGGYVRGEGIKVCINQISLQDEVNQVVIHELVHAYDDCRAKNMDWANCAHHACSEIRAAHLSGDCHYKRELIRNGVNKLRLRSKGQECVKRRALLSVMNNPHCSEAAARDAVEAVWDTCYNDTKPFDRAP
ncbi:Mitochondrial inner membrane protease atp23 [Ranunculus cassubicifolius]